MDLVFNQTTYKILIFHKMPEVKFKGSILTKKGHFDYKTGIFRNKKQRILLFNAHISVNVVRIDSEISGNIRLPLMLMKRH